MTNELTTTSQQDVVSRLSKGIKTARRALPAQSSLQFMKYNKGSWVFGVEDIEPEEGSLWAVNPLQIKHGFTCWTRYPKDSGKKDELLGEVYGSILTDEEPIKVEDLPKHEYPWSPAASIQLKCLNGEDKDVEVLFKTSTNGGLNFINKLFDALESHLDEGGEDIVPVITLESGSYTHQRYGKTFIPEFKVKKWMPLAGPVKEEKPKQVTKNSAPEVNDDEPQHAEETEVVVEQAAPAAKTRTRRRRN